MKRSASLGGRSFVWVVWSSSASWCVPPCRFDIVFTMFLVFRIVLVLTLSVCVIVPFVFRVSSLSLVICLVVVLSDVEYWMSCLGVVMSSSLCFLKRWLGLFGKSIDVLEKDSNGGVSSFLGYSVPELFSHLGFYLVVS